MKGGPFQVALGMALFLMIASAIMIVVEEPGTAGFVLSVLTFAIGVAFMGVVVWAIRRTSK